MTLFKLRWPVLLLALFWTLPARAIADPSPPLSVIVAKVIERDDANQKALQSMEYHQHLKTERLDEHDQVTQRQEMQMIVRPGARDEVQVISEKGDNLPANPDQAALQAQGKKAQSQKMNFSLKDMVNRFNVHLEGTDTIGNQPVYVIAFEPKPNQPYRDQTEKVLNRLHGRMWVSTHDYSVMRTEATLAEPVNVAWIFAQVSGLSFRYDLDNSTGGMGPARIETFVKVDAPFISFRQRMTVDITQFEPRNKT
jgi:hypothetical protein